MKNNSEEDQSFFLKGQFLLAMPDLADTNFSRTVTCITEHTKEGAFGIIINRISTSITAKNIFDELKIEYVPDANLIPAYFGGPVHAGEIFILHGQPFDSESCFMITPFLAMSNTLDILTAIAGGNGPKSYIIALGCAGWGPGQLEYEIKENTWLNCGISEDIIFNTPVEARWKETAKKMGINPALLSGMAGHA